MALMARRHQIPAMGFIVSVSVGAAGPSWGGGSAKGFLALGQGALQIDLELDGDRRSRFAQAILPKMSSPRAELPAQGGAPFKQTLTSLYAVRLAYRAQGRAPSR